MSANNAKANLTDPERQIFDQYLIEYLLALFKSFSCCFETSQRVKGDTCFVMEGVSILKYRMHQSYLM